MYLEYTDLIGMVFKRVKNDANEELVFQFSNGSGFKFYHDQQCCEHVYIEDIVGDLRDLENFPILIANESTKDDPDTQTFWTFYTFATIKGVVTVRWSGAYNYYSTSVEFTKYEKTDN